jgi:hypothetical protein
MTMNCILPCLLLGVSATQLDAQLVSRERLAKMDQGITAATAVAEPWLGLMDAGRVDEAWAQVAVVLRRDSSTAWMATLRPQTGNPYTVVGREVLTLQQSFVRPPFTFPEFVRFEFAVRYNNETLGGEELIVVHDVDGVWRVAAYARRPGPPQNIPGNPPGTNR